MNTRDRSPVRELGHRIRDTPQPAPAQEHPGGGGRGRVKVSAPADATDDYLRAFVRRRAEWIIRNATEEMLAASRSGS